MMHVDVTVDDEGATVSIILDDSYTPDLLTDACNRAVTAATSANQERKTSINGDT